LAFTIRGRFTAVAAGPVRSMAARYRGAAGAAGAAIGIRLIRWTQSSALAAAGNITRPESTANASTPDRAGARPAPPEQL
jgi:hypothetical protein